MTNTDRKESRAKRVMSLLARILSIISVSVLLLFYIGEGFNPFLLNVKELVLQFFFPLGTVFGMVVAWRYERLGGIISVASLICFYAIHYITSGYLPKGLAFITFTFPGFLFLINGILRTKIK